MVKVKVKVKVEVEVMVMVKVGVVHLLHQWTLVEKPQLDHQWLYQMQDHLQRRHLQGRRRRSVRSVCTTGLAF